MIGNLQYWLWKYLTGPTCDSSEYWCMSDTSTVKYKDMFGNVLYTLTFDIEKERVNLRSLNDTPTSIFSMSNEIKVNLTFDFKDCLKILKERNLLNGWKPTWLKYTKEELEFFGYVETNN
ncbi:MAG: hypothetical protein MJZ34_11290 [Paludibacteraceae bacterium]|nr:hypothetical protein [Paludibacteraceae bacterium]